MLNRRTVVDMNFQSLAQQCENQYSKFKGTTQGFIRFFYKKHMEGVNNVAMYAALSLPNAIRRMVQDNMSLRDNPRMEFIFVSTAKEFAEDIRTLNLASVEVANGKKYRLKSNEVALIRGFAKKSVRHGTAVIFGNIRVNNSGKTSLNVWEIADDPNDTDTEDRIPWADVVKGIPLTDKGALVDLFVYEREGKNDLELIEYLGLYIDDQGLEKISESVFKGGKVLWQRTETAARHVNTKRAVRPDNEEELLKWMITNQYDEPRFLSFLTGKEFGTSIHLSRTTIVHELLKKYEDMLRVQDVIQRWKVQHSAAADIPRIASDYKE